MKRLSTKLFRLSAACVPAFMGVLAVLAVMFFTPSCTDEQTDPPYVAVTSGSFTFSENTAINIISVESNTDWEVTWTPALEGVVITPASGRGEAVLLVEDMPKGVAIRVAVSHGSGDNLISSNSVSVVRGSDGAGLYLTLDPESTLEYSATNPETNVVNVVTNPNAVWTAVPSDAALKVSPASGTGPGAVTVTDIPAGRSYTLAVSVGEGEGKITRTVTVSRPDPSQEARLLYYNNFDKAKATQSYSTPSGSTTWPYLGQSDCWQNATGDGITAMTHIYSTSGISARANFNTGTYAGASKVNNLMFNYAGNFLEIRNISLPSGLTPPGYELSFATSAEPGYFNVYVSGDGSRWARVPFEVANNTSWKPVTVKFSLNRTVSNLSLMIELVKEIPAGGYPPRLDDVKLTTATSAGTQIDIESVPADRWAELPANSTRSNFKIFTEYSSTVLTGQSVRNFTVGYDTRLHCPLWVAHPQHFCYQEGGVTRSDPDPWAMDPNLSESEQSYIYDGYSWVTSSFNGTPRRWGRGHMLASSYRGAGADAANPAELNRQTFRTGNIAPQSGTAFDKLWAAAEMGIYDNCVCADTLYCISGAWFENENTTAKDKSTLGSDGQVTNQSGAKDCGVPTHYYKVLLRTRDGNTGKAVKNCSASELQAVAFWFTHADTDPVSNSTAPTEVTQAYMMSVKELGDKVGFDFFPDVPAAVKSAAPVALDWGLPYAVTASAE